MPIEGGQITDRYREPYEAYLGGSMPIEGGSITNRYRTPYELYMGGAMPVEGGRIANRYRPAPPIPFLGNSLPIEGGTIDNRYRAPLDLYMGGAMPIEGGRITKDRGELPPTVITGDPRSEFDKRLDRLGETLIERAGESELLARLMTGSRNLAAGLLQGGRPPGGMTPGGPLGASALGGGANIFQGWQTGGGTDIYLPLITKPEDMDAMLGDQPDQIGAGLMERISVAVEERPLVQTLRQLWDNDLAANAGELTGLGTAIANKINESLEENLGALGDGLISIIVANVLESLAGSEE
jgi:hypothetical protein